MSELSPEAKAILEQARGEGAPTEADRARVESALAAALGALPSPSSPQPPPAAQPVPKPVALPGTGSVVVSALARAMVVATLAAAGAAGIVVWSRPAAQAPARGPGATPSVRVTRGPAVQVPAPRPQPEPDFVLPGAAPTLVPVSPAQGPRLVPVQRPAPVFAPLDLREPGSAAPSSPGLAPRPGEGALADELLLVRQAQLKARSGDAAGALELLDAHARRFPEGTLREERTAARVQALCALGRVEEAKGEAERFLAENPRSPYSGRVQGSCGAPGR